MAELFKGQAGSPITYLAADISANQTTISIDDDSASSQACFIKLFSILPPKNL